MDMPDIHLLVARDRVEMRFTARGHDYAGVIAMADDVTPERAIGTLLKSARATVRVLGNRAQS